MARRPNIVLITGDQHRADTLGCAGHPCVETPHLDLLAYQGTRFTNAHADCPVCIPARTTLITGRRAHENGKAEYGADYRLDRDRRDILGSLLTEAGYQTELVGKTHFHSEPDFRAGFEHVTWFASLRRQQMLESGKPGLQAGLGYNASHTALSPFPPHLNQTNWAVEKACDFLETRERSQPFALWVSTNDPHPPYFIHEPYYSMYEHRDIPEPVVADWVGTDAEPINHFVQRHQLNKGPMTPAEVRAMRRVYYGMVTNLDHQVGRLIAQLEYLGDLDDTLIVYTADHGEALGDHGAVAKRSFLSCSAKLPMIVRPPKTWGLQPGQVCDGLVEWADLLPTLCDAAGARVPDDVTGRSMLPHVRGESATVGGHVMHGHIESRHMLHDGRYKFIYDTDDGSEQCFDTRDDPDDLHPLTGEHPGRLRKILIEHMTAEGHEHVADGKLLNRGKAKPSVEELRASGAYALGPTRHFGDIRRDVMWIN